jgi:hypothetical protein
MTTNTTAICPDELLDPLVQELQTMAQSNWKGTTAWMESETGLLDSPRARDIGKLAYSIGGMEGMYEVLQRAFLDADGYALDGASSAAISEIGYAWNDIGTWQA